jgi:hypothetical protein
MYTRNPARRVFCVFLFTVLVQNLAVASEEATTAELAQAVQNPIANLISLPLQNNTDFNFGPQDETLNTLNVQPVWPFEISDGWNLITRTIVPIVSQPGLTPGQSRETGLGDTTFTAFLSPKDSGKWTWGAGPVVLIPTNTDSRLGPDEWGIGASFVVLTMPGSWVVGSLFSNVWDINASAGKDVNLFTWQYFINYNMAGGWFLTSAPIMTANWEARSGQKWTIPVGGGAGRVFRIGKQPVTASAQYFYNLEHPDQVGDWSLRLHLQFMFPK